MTAWPSWKPGSPRGAGNVAATHDYRVEIVWTGNRGTGTSAYRAYDRDHDIHIAGKPILRGSADAAFRGTAECHNPEELLLAAISACHMLWYLHLCAEAGIVVSAYHDRAQAQMVIEADGGGQFSAATLRPEITIAAGDLDTAHALHARAHALCFIARSLAFPIHHQPLITRSATPET